MTCFYKSSVQDFLALPEEYLRDRLQNAYARRGFNSQFTDQTLTWEQDIRTLKSSLNQCLERTEAARSWQLLLEFVIPRKEKRIDCVLLVGDILVIVEAKTRSGTAEARRQIEEYALLLYYFHKASAGRRIVPVLVSLDAPTADFNALSQREMFPQLPSHWITPVLSTSWSNLADLLIEVSRARRASIVCRRVGPKSLSPCTEHYRSSIGFEEWLIYTRDRSLGGFRARNFGRERNHSRVCRLSES